MWKMQILYLVSFVVSSNFVSTSYFLGKKLKIVVFYHWKQELMFSLSTLIAKRFS